MPYFKILLKSVLVLVLLLLLVLAVVILMPRQWLVNKIETVASDFSGYEIDIGSLDYKLLSLSPTISLSNSSISNSTENIASIERLYVQTSWSNISKRSTDLKVLEVSNVELNLLQNEEGSWNFALPINDEGVEEQQTAADVEGFVLPAISSIEVNDTRIIYTSESANRNLTALVNASGSTTDASQPFVATVTGVLQERPIEIDVSLLVQSMLASDAAKGTLAVSGDYGNTRLSIEGQIGKTLVSEHLDLAVSVEADGLDDIEAAVGLPLPDLPPFNIAGQLIRDESEYVFQRFGGAIGSSDIEGDVRLNPFIKPVGLYANVISKQLVVDDFLGLFGVELPQPGKEAKKANSVSNDKEGRESLLPTKSMHLEKIIPIFNGAVRFRAAAVQTDLLPIESIDARLEIESSKVKAAPFEMELAGGLLSGDVEFDVSSGEPVGLVDLKLQGIQLRELFKAIGVDDDSFGVLGGRAKFWMSGESLATMAASADGGMFLIMTGGKLDALLVELAGVDLTESITLLLDPGKTLTPIHCAYIDVHSTGGLVDVNRFVIDSDDTVFLGDGTIDLNNETLALVLEPHPKDISLLAAQTAVEINGSFLKPSLKPGNALMERAAAALVLGALASPIAAIIPFIQSGLGEDSVYCNGLAESMDDARDK